MIVELKNASAGNVQGLIGELYLHRKQLKEIGISEESLKIIENIKISEIEQSVFADALFGSD